MRLDRVFVLVFAFCGCSASPGDSGPGSALPEPCTPGQREVQLGFEMVCLAPDTFSMGWPADELGGSGNDTRREITLTRPFWIATTEATIAQHGDGASWGCRSDDCPVVNLSWHEVAIRSNQLSREAGLEPCYRCEGVNSLIPECELSPNWATPYDCPGFRLPTEAEWEYAARAGTTTAFSNGGSLLQHDEGDCSTPLPLDNGVNLDDWAWYCGNDEGVAHPVAQLEPNSWGLYDVHGNLWEWTHDTPAQLPSLDPQTDPWGETSGVHRVARGGSFDYPPASQRSGSASNRQPTNSPNDTGYRLARSAR